jgi:uncharacterized protein (DUF1697 family)
LKTTRSPTSKRGSTSTPLSSQAIPRRAQLEALRKQAVEGEAIEVIEKVAYLHTPFGLGTSKLGEKFNKGIGVGNTARNWNTVLKLQELAKKAAG